MEDPPEIKPHICETCYLILDSEDLLKSHRLTCEENKPHVCHTCHNVYKCENELIEHSSIQHGHKNINVLTKQETFQDKDEGIVKKEEDSESEKKPYLCDKCYLIFTDQQEFISHTKSHEENKYECATCKMTFPLKEALDLHQQVYTECSVSRRSSRENEQGDVVFMCAFGKLVFHKEETLNNHLRTHSSGHVETDVHKVTIKDEVPSTGDIGIKCEKVETGKDELNEHVHTNDKEQSDQRHKCHVCDKTYVRRYDLNQHLLMHTGENYHHCDQCDKSFNWLSNLKKHMKVHTGIEPFQCNKCTKSFARKAHLSRHQIVHAKKESFECELCGRCYTRMKDLTYHKLKVKHAEEVHAGCKCYVCGKVYLRTYDLTRHMLTHGVSEQHDDKMCQKMSSQKECPTVKCHHDICEKSFRKESELEAHRNGHTEKVPPENQHVISSQKCDISVKHDIDKVNAQKTMSISEEADMVQHTTTSHSDEKLFKCTQCDKSFKWISNLHQHMNLHSQPEES